MAAGGFAGGADIADNLVLLTTCQPAETILDDKWEYKVCVPLEWEITT